MSAEVELTERATVNLVRQVDRLVALSGTLESENARISAEVAKMGPVVQNLSKKVAAKAKSEEPRGPQPDWVGCRNPIVAVELLQTARTWVETYLVPYGRQAWPSCWPWHPPAVIAALFLDALTVQAFTNGKVSEPGDLFVRWVPITDRLVLPATAACMGAHFEQHGKQKKWTVDLDGMEE